MTAVMPDVCDAFDTDMFGAVSVAEKNVLRFDEGLLGFPSCKRWVVLEGARTGTAWLQSADHKSLAFLLVDPFVAFDGFSVDIDETDLKRIEAAHETDLLVYALVTVPASGATVTANLNGPIVVDIRARRGMQVVLRDSGWGVRHPLPPHILSGSAKS